MHRRLGSVHGSAAGVLAVLGWFASVAGLAQQATQTPNTVTTTITAKQSIAAGTAVFQIQFVETNLGSSLDSALGVLGNAGASASNLTSIGVTISQGFVVTQYNFVIPVAASQFSSTRDRLITIQRALANSTSQAIAWNVNYAPADEDAAKAVEQALPGMLTKAKRQAGLLAAAMGKTLGDVVALSSPAVGPTSEVGVELTLTATFAVQ